MATNDRAPTRVRGRLVVLVLGVVIGVTALALITIHVRRTQRPPAAPAAPSGAPAR